jgi:hypothetical protein
MVFPKIRRLLFHYTCEAAEVDELEKAVGPEGATIVKLKVKRVRPRRAFC